MKPELIEIWSTKYALTQGIEQVAAEDIGDGMVRVKGRRDFFDYLLHGEGREWHRTYKSAKEEAEKKRIKKIASLKMSIAKLEAMGFK